MNTYINEEEKIVCIWQPNASDDEIKAYTDKGYKVFLTVNGNEPVREILRRMIHSRFS